MVKKEIVINSVYSARKKRKVTQEKLAQALGVTRQTIIAIEKGSYTPSVCLALKIAKYFKVNVEKIFKVKCR
jgi:putative transcriptional regulator